MVELQERTKKCPKCDGQGNGCNKCSNGVVDVITQVEDNG